MKELYEKWQEYSKQVNKLISNLLEENEKLKKEKTQIKAHYEQALKDYDALLQKGEQCKF